MVVRNVVEPKKVRGSRNVATSCISYGKINVNVTVVLFATINTTKAILALFERLFIIKTRDENIRNFLLGLLY
jgi:hypothetical protein